MRQEKPLYRLKDGTTELKTVDGPQFASLTADVLFQDVPLSQIHEFERFTES